jgi:hypothetical protein
LYFEAAAGITTNFESTSGSFATAVWYAMFQYRYQEPFEIFSGQIICCGVVVGQCVMGVY